ncbi:MAG: APC family permease [Actinomycetales bacterium]|jgi:amino acid transporter|nr:APC family permease [Leifsonia sp.]
MEHLEQQDPPRDPEVSLEHGHTSLGALTVLGLSAQQIGPGIALAGGYMILYAGNASWVSMLVALVVSASIGAIVVTFSRRLVASGGLMSYVSSVLGPYGRALTGSGYLIGLLIAAAAVTTGVVIFTASFLVQIGATWAASPLAQGASAVVIAVLAGAIAYRGVDTSVKVSAVLTFVGIPFVIWVTLAAALAAPHYSIAPQFDFSSSDFSWSGIFQGALVALSYFVGFDGLSAMAGETKDPKKNLPRFILLLLGITGAAYVAILWFQIPALAGGTKLLENGDSPTAVLAHLGNVGWLAAPLDLLMAAATFAGLVATFNYGSRIIGTAAEARLLPRGLAHVNPRFRSPSRAVIFLVIISAGIPIAFELVAATPPLESSVLLYTLFSYCYFIPYVVAAVAAIVLVVRERRANPLMIAVYAFAGISFGYLLFYALTSAGGGAFGALPWIALILTAVGFVGLLIVDRRSAGAGEALSDLL